MTPWAATPRNVPTREKDETGPGMTWAEMAKIENMRMKGESRTTKLWDDAKAALDDGELSTHEVASAIELATNLPTCVESVRSNLTRHANMGQVIKRKGERRVIYWRLA